MMQYPKFLTTVTPLSKILALVLLITFPLFGFASGVWYQKMLQNDYIDDPRLKIFSTQKECETFTDRTCVPTLCETNPQHVTCQSNSQKGWFATRQPLGETTEQEDDVTGWKTYTSNALGITLSYPSSWQVPLEKPGTTSSSLIFNDGYEGQGVYQTVRLDIAKGVLYNQELQRNLTFEEYLERFSPISYQMISQNDYTIGPYSGKQFTYFDGEVYYTNLILGLSPKEEEFLTFYYRHMGSEATNSVSFPATLQQIMNFLQFLDEGNTNQQLTSSKDVESFCKKNNGTFLYQLNEKNKYMECENIDKQVCNSAGGTFNTCTSACRHDSNTEICNDMCIPVCSF